MGSWEQSPFSFFMSYNAACNYFMMTLISHSFIKVTSTIFSDFFFILVDFLALKRGGGVEGLKREWNGYSILELPLTQTQSTKLLVIFSSPKALHWKTARVKQLCRNLLVFLSACSGSGWGGCRCWPSIHHTSQAGGSWEVKASIHDLSVGSFFPSLLLTFLSQQKAARLPQSRRDIFNERMLNFHQIFSSDVGLPCHIPPPVFSFSEQWSEFKELQCQCRVFGHVVLPLLTHPSATEHRLYRGHVCAWLQGDSHQGCSTSGSSRCPQCVHWWCGKQIWII